MVDYGIRLSLWEGDSPLRHPVHTNLGSAEHSLL
jgi:hypothetical protein